MTTRFLGRRPAVSFTEDVHETMTLEESFHRARAAQVGFLMRSYRESYRGPGGRRGLSQNALLERMAQVDEEYANRFSHGTVSRWESGRTRPTVSRLVVFGRALGLSDDEVVGLIVLAGLAPDYGSAAEQAGVKGYSPAAVETGTPGPDAGATSGFPEDSGVLRELGRFIGLRILPLGLGIVALGYLLSFPGWSDSWMPVFYGVAVTSAVLAQRHLKPDRDAGLRDFFWVSVFFLLTTPVLQFAPVGMDHYNFYMVEGFAGTHMPWMLLLLVNLGLASLAGVMFHLLSKWRYPGSGESTVPGRAASVVLPPVILVYGAAVVISNLSVVIQLGVVFTVLALVFGGLLALRDPRLVPTPEDRRFVFPPLTAIAILATALGVGIVVFVYASPDYPSILPDHNLVASWDIDFEELGYSREEALDRVNIGYLWHAIPLTVYMAFIVGGSLLMGVYRMAGGGESPSQLEGAPVPAEAARVERPGSVRNRFTRLVPGGIRSLPGWACNGGFRGAV